MKFDMNLKRGKITQIFYKKKKPVPQLNAWNGHPFYSVFDVCVPK